MGYNVISYTFKHILVVFELFIMYLGKNKDEFPFWYDIFLSAGLRRGSDEETALVVHISGVCWGIRILCGEKGFHR